MAETIKSTRSRIPDSSWRWEIIIANRHFDKLLLCVITIWRTVLQDIIKSHFLLPSLGQLGSTREHVNKGASSEKIWLIASVYAFHKPSTCYFSGGNS